MNFNKLFVIALLFLAGISRAQFEGPFAPEYWTLTGTSTNSNASIDLTGAPGSIVFKGNDSDAGDCCGLYDTYSVVVPCGDVGSGTISVDYDFVQPDIEEFHYVVNGVSTFVTDVSQTGTISIGVNAGDEFGFRIVTDDDCCGMGVLTLTNFSYSDADQTPPTLEIVQLPELNAECSVTPDSPVAIDNCLGMILGTSDTSFPISAEGATTITWTFTDLYGNSVSQNQTIIISTPIVLTATSAMETAGNDGSIDLTVSGASGLTLFDWSNDGTGDTDDTEDLSGLTAGAYSVLVMDGAGCSKALTVVVENVSVSENKLGISVYPNPAADLIQIKYNSDQPIIAQFYSLEGKLILSKPVQKSNDQINVSELASGIYMIRFYSGETEIYQHRMTKL